ncbi:MAG: hypothetical protein IJX18_01445, partial [Clostridia bacterium]|nr:hypothetical protein [Clostridia bacterium]
MKKKLLLGLLSAFCVTASASMLASCGHTHDYTDVVTPPTCTEEGYTTHTCECGDSYVDASVAALGHEFTDYVSNGDATCEADGTETAT